MVAPKVAQFTDKDKPAQVRSSNIIASKGTPSMCMHWTVLIIQTSTALADSVRTSLGPKGMDKMVCLPIAQCYCPIAQCYCPSATH
jgi:hypothetical protein